MVKLESILAKDIDDVVNWAGQLNTKLFEPAARALLEVVKNDEQDQFLRYHAARAIPALPPHRPYASASTKLWSPQLIDYALDTLSHIYFTTTTVGFKDAALRAIEAVLHQRYIARK